MSLLHLSLCPSVVPRFYNQIIILVSFDVFSVFTNMSWTIDLTTDVTRCRLQSDPSPQSRTDLCAYIYQSFEILSYIYSATYLSWRCISADVPTLWTIPWVYWTWSETILNLFSKLPKCLLFWHRRLKHWLIQQAMVPWFKLSVIGHLLCWTRYVLITVRLQLSLSVHNYSC